MEKNPEKYSANNDPESSFNEMTLFGNLLDSSRSMITIIDNHYTYVRVNAKFSSAHKLDSGSVIGKNISHIWGDNVFVNKIKKKIDFNVTIFRNESLKRLSHLAAMIQLYLEFMVHGEKAKLQL